MDVLLEIPRCSSTASPPLTALRIDGHRRPPLGEGCGTLCFPACGQGHRERPQNAGGLRPAQSFHRSSGWYFVLRVQFGSLVVRQWQVATVMAFKKLLSPQLQHPGDGAALARGGQRHSALKVAVCAWLSVDGKGPGPGGGCISSGCWHHLVLCPVPPGLSLSDHSGSRETPQPGSRVGQQSGTTAWGRGTWAPRCRIHPEHLVFALLFVLCFPGLFS